MKEVSIAKTIASVIPLNTHPEIQLKWKPDNRHGKRGKKCREDDLLGGVDDRLLQRLPYEEMSSYSTMQCV